MRNSVDRLGRVPSVYAADLDLAPEPLQRIPTRATHLFWIAHRRARSESDQAVGYVRDLPDEQLEALMNTLSIAEAAGLVRMLTSPDSESSELIGDRRLASVLRTAAASPEALGTRPDALILIAQLWDSVRYGRAALLGFDSGEREATAEGFRTALATREALGTVEEALASSPYSSDLIWLRRQLDRASIAERESFPPGIAIRVTVPVPSSGEDARSHVLIDGVPLVERLYDRGFADPPEQFLRRARPLEARSEPHDVCLAEPECSEGCCGALRVEIRRDDAAEQVHWEVRHTGDSTMPPERFAFDAAAYDAEIARAAAISDWEWPARRAARLLEERLTAEPELLSRWDCRLHRADSWNGERSRLRLTFTFPADPPGRSDWLQFMFIDEVPDSSDMDAGAAEATVERLVALFRTTDPKSVAELCGGSREGAEAFGYSWPPA